MPHVEFRIHRGAASGFSQAAGDAARAWGQHRWISLGARVVKASLAESQVVFVLTGHCAIIGLRYLVPCLRLIAGGAFVTATPLLFSL